VDLTILEVLRDTVLITCIALIPPLLLIDILVQRWQVFKLQKMILARLDSLIGTPIISVSRESINSSDTERRIERLEGGVLLLNERTSNDTELRAILNENNVLLRDFIEVMKSQQAVPIQQVQYRVEPDGKLGKHFPARISQNIETIAAPSKMELAINWLQEHSEDTALTGRDLEAARLPMGVRISYRTWNDAKKQLI
jgi:hypothetical protein